ncbi:hypothetical protein Tco_1308500 [Tanacetum coccineum]
MEFGPRRYSMWRNSKLDEVPQGKVVDPTHYRGMVGTLMYLISSRPDLTFVICMCAQYQAKPIKKHLHAIKRIFKYLRGTVNRGFWYLKDSSIALTAYADAANLKNLLDRVSSSKRRISNRDVLDSPCLLVLITGTSQSRQHGKSESDSYYLSV